MWPIIVCKVYKNYQVEYRDELIIEKDDSLVKGRTQKESQNRKHMDVNGSTVFELKNE